MLLKDLVKTGQKQFAPRMMVIGEEGVGKSTFGNKAEKPLFVCGENGLVGPEFASTPNTTPRTWPETISSIDALVKENHDFKTIVFDTVDWMEPMLSSFICQRDGKENIEAYGYGKGYVVAAIEWRKLLARLENLRQAKNVGIIFLAHCQIKNFSNPSGDNYDRYQAKCSKDISALTREWCDVVMFAKFETYTVKEAAKGKAKGVGTDTRVVYTSQSASWDAKNRYSMPKKLALDYSVVMDAIRTGKPASDDDLKKEINELITSSAAFSSEDRKAVESAIEKKCDLKSILNKCRVKAA